MGMDVLKKLFSVICIIALLSLMGCGGSQPDDETPLNNDEEDTSLHRSVTMTEIGNMTYSIQANMCIGGYDQDGNPRLYCGINGDSYASFQIVDPVSGTLIQSYKLSTSLSVYEVFAHSSGDIYLTAFKTPALYRYQVKTGEFTLVAQMEQNLVAMSEDKGGNLICGLVGNDQFFVYSPKSNQLKRYAVPKATAIAQYATAYNPANGNYYVLSRDDKSKTCIYRYTSLDRAPEDILPNAYKKLTNTIFDINIIGNRLVCQTQGQNQLILLNPTSGRVINVINSSTGERMTEIPCTVRSISPVSPDGKYFYFVDHNRKICQYNLVNDTFHPVSGLSVWSFVINWDFFDLNDGLCLIGLDGSNGAMIVYNIDKKTVSHMTVELEGTASLLSCIDMDKDGILYAGSSSCGAGYYDPGADTLVELPGLPAVDDVCATERYVFYTRNVSNGVQVLAYDRSKEWNMTNSTASNPSPVCTISSSVFPQSGTLSMLAVEKENIILVATSPAEDYTTGALCIIDLTTLDYHVKFDLVSDHSVTAMAYADGVVYCATTANDGASSAQLVACTIANDRYTYMGDIHKSIHGVKAMVLGPDGDLWGIGSAYHLFQFSLEKNAFVQAQELSVVSAEKKDAVSLCVTKDVLYMNCRENQSFYAIPWRDLTLNCLKSSCGWDMRMRKNGQFYFIRNFNLFQITVGKS